MVMLDLWDQRATLGPMDLRGQKAIRDLKAKKDLLALMVCRVFQVYKDLRDLQELQAAMEQMERMDLLVFPGPTGLMDMQVHLVRLGLRVSLGYQWVQYQGHLGHLGGMECRGLQVPLDSMDHQGTVDHGALLGLVAVLGLQDLRDKRV